MNFMMLLRQKTVLKQVSAYHHMVCFLVSVEYPAEYFQVMNIFFILFKTFTVSAFQDINFYAFKKDLAGNCRYLSLRPALKIKRLVL